MIAVDTSALAAIIFDEPERDHFVKRIVESNVVLVSAVSVVEARMVVHGRRGPRAFVIFGKGSGHPAGLNFGDVFSYALAKVQAVPLLFNGNDFAQTDLVSALT
jgi:ribonuclease VapC